MRQAWRVSGLCVLTLAAVLSAACRDSTGPGAGVQIALRADVGTPVVDTINSSSEIACEAHLVATPSGSGAASWTGGTVDFFAGHDRSHPIDSQPMTASDVSGLFGTAAINAGTPIQGTVDISASVPFSIHLTLRYRSERTGVERSAAVDIGCGSVPAAGSPNVSNLVVSPATGHIQLGDSLAVTYIATSPAGLWQTTVSVPLPTCGDFTQKYSDGGKTTVQRTVYVRLPSICALGQHITAATITISDGDLASTSKTANFDLTIADDTPPRILLDSLAGDFFTGDTLSYDWWVTDNNRIVRFGWELPGTSYRDSIDAAQATGSLRVSIPTRPEWAPAFQLRLFAVDAAGNRAEFTGAPNGMRLHPTVQRTITSLRLADQYSDFVLDERRGLAYLLGAYKATVGIVSLSPLQFLGSIALSDIGTSFDITPSGDSLLITLNQRTGIAIVDLTKPDRPVTVKSIDGLNAFYSEMPTMLRIAANGHAILNTWSSLSPPPAAPFLDLDPATWTTKRLDFGALRPLVLNERSGDRRVFILRDQLVGIPMGFIRFDPITGAAGPSIALGDPMGAPAGALSLDYTGQHIAFGLDVYDTQFHKISHSPALTGDFTVISGDGSTLWQSGAINYLVRTRSADGIVIDRSAHTELGRARFTSDNATMVMLTLDALKLIDAR